MRRRAMRHLHAGHVDGCRATAREIPIPTMAEIREGLAGNLCRCTGFMRIFESVVAAAGGETAEPAAERGAPCAVTRKCTT